MIDMLRDLEEIWTRNSMTGSTDRASTVRAVEHGESAVAFETALQDARTAEEGQTSPISVEHVNLSLNAVTETVFLHKALETQQLWMNRKMFKPVELTTRQMAASINRLNNSLPFFPTATEASKINLLAKISSKKKILEMYASVINREQAKLDDSKKPEKRRKIVAPESESDDEFLL
jgi:hypothetical protein